MDVPRASRALGDHRVDAAGDSDLNRQHSYASQGFPLPQSDEVPCRHGGLAAVRVRRALIDGLVSSPYVTSRRAAALQCADGLRIDPDARNPAPATARYASCALQGGDVAGVPEGFGAGEGGRPDGA